MAQLSLIGLKLLTGFVVFALDLSCASILIFLSKWFIRKRNYAIISCFSGGMLLSASFVQLLWDAEKSPSIDTDGPDKGLPLVHILCGCGVIFTLMIQQIMIAISQAIQNKTIKGHLQSSGENIVELREVDSEGIQIIEDYDGIRRKAYYVAVLFYSIALIEGLISGCTLGLQMNRGSVITMLIAIASHDWIEVMICMFNFLSATSPNELKGRKHKAIMFLLACGASSINFVGIGIGIGIQGLMTEEMLFKIASGATAFTSGCFLYISLAEMLSKQLPDTGHFMGFKIVLSDQDEVSTESKPKFIIFKLIATTLGFVASALMVLVVRN